MTSTSGIKLILLVVLFLVLGSQVLLASQLYRLDVDVSQEVFSLQGKKESDFLLEENNARNTIFQLTEDILRLITERGPDDSSKTIVSASIDANILLSPDLKLSFSLSSPQLDSNSSAARITLWLTHGTSLIHLNYVSGYQEQDWKRGSYSYFFCKIGNGTNIWIRNERDIWIDMLSKDPSLKETDSWRIFKIDFGVISYFATTDSRMEVIFNTNETSLHNGRDPTRVKVTTSMLKPSQPVALMMVLSISVVLGALLCARRIHGNCTLK